MKFILVLVIPNKLLIISSGTVAFRRRHASPPKAEIMWFPVQKYIDREKFWILAKDSSNHVL